MNKKKQESLDAANSIKAVIYARYSSSGQREESIEGQIRDCREYAKKNGFLVVGEYIDKALTGRSDKRPDFQRMLKVVGQDLDYLAVYMTYIACSFYGIDAIIVQGDTLQEPFTDGYDERRIFRTPKNVGAII